MSKAKQLKLCINCLRGNHEVKDCRFGNCRICNSKHNSILHDSQQTQSTTVQLAVSPVEQDDAHIDKAIAEPTTCAVATGSNAILSTVLVNVLDKDHKAHSARALLDCGSQSSFVSKDLADKLHLDKHKTSLCISGISNNLSYSKFKCVLKVFSKCSDFSTEISCFIIEKITGNLPDFPIHTNDWNIPCNIKLADPTYNKPGKIDILIGADVFWQLLCVGQINIGSDKPLLQKTRLGWVVAGFHNSKSQVSKSSCHLSHVVDIQKTLSQFWEVEEVSSTTKPMSLEEKLCEKHFSDNLQVFPTGDSGHTAGKRFLQLEKRLLSNPTMLKLYIDFMRQYEDLGHMTKLTDEHTNPDYFMPHHGVLKENSLTTKLRTVFNASCPSATGVSLNSLQMVGPIFQPDLLAILLSFRFHEIILSSDIKMMYRMVLINPDQRHFQKIIWRESPDQPMSVFQLNTVTYGTASGSFLAIRSLFQVVYEVEDEFPEIAKIIRTHMSKWKRVLFTRSIAMVPTFCTAFFSNLSDLTSLNDYLNAVMSLQLPFALIPTIAFTSNSKIMGSFTNGIVIKIISLMLSVTIVAINIYFVVEKLLQLSLQLYIVTVVYVLASCYFVFILYLVIHLYIAMGGTWMRHHPAVSKFVMVEIGQQTQTTEKQEGNDV
nr:unnamed protein product [Callosobruchus chinensis]